MVKKLSTFLILLSLILFSTNKALGQWNIFGEERAERFNQPKDSTDIYKTIEEKFGTGEKEMVKERLTKTIYLFKFEKYLEGKTASEVLNLIKRVNEEIESLIEFRDNYRAKLTHKKVDTIIGEETRYYIEIESLFNKQISELDVELWLYAYRDLAEGVVEISKKNLSLNPNEKIEIFVSKNKINEESGGRKRFKYNISIDRVGFSDFNYFDTDEYERAIHFMKRSELQKFSQKRVFSGSNFQN